MKRRTWIALGWTVLLVLGGCASGPRGFRTTGGLRILAAVPDVTAGCRVRAGDWMVLTGNDFGSPADWRSGANRLRFSPGVAPPRIELTREKDPATLFFLVPQGAQSGPVRLHVEGVGDAAFTVVVEAGVAAANAVPGCALPSAPQGNP